MASKSLKTLGKFIQKSKFEQGTGALLPEAYRKFYKEWKLTEPTAVHYIPEEGRWRRDEITGEVHPIQNVPIPVIYPPEHNQHIWGGEGVVQGFIKRVETRRRVPHFWMPTLKRSVVYSEILNKHMSIIVTDRTINLINANYGFDHYLLKTPACDLKSLLALGLKRKILQELQKGCPTYADQPELQQKIYQRYKKYLEAYTPEEIEWYGYSFSAACRKLEEAIEQQNQPVPLKHIYRSKLIEKLRDAGIKEADLQKDVKGSRTAAWLERVNIFSKKHET